MRRCTSSEEQKGTSYNRGNVYFGLIIFSCFSSAKLCLGFLLICFALEIKGFYQSSLGNEVDFKKLETRFCRWKSNDYSNINIFLLLENPCTFLLAKERPENAFFNTNSELAQNCTEKQIISKNCLNSELAIYWYMMLFSQ